VRERETERGAERTGSPFRLSTEDFHMQHKIVSWWAPTRQGSRDFFGQKKLQGGILTDVKRGCALAMDMQ
jgi:hypothetical protein